jgi:PAS domain S-box-containing protein
MTPMNALGPTGAETWLLSVPPTRRQTRWAIAVAVCQVAALALVAPFARTRLAEINAFIPAFGGVIFVTDLVTSVLLFSQFAIYRLRALLVLACGYLFSALMIIPHALTFPGAFSPTGLLGAGLQTTASLYWFWHLLFPLALLGYGLMRDEKFDLGPAQPSLRAVIVRSITLVVALVCGLTLLATTGNDYLPVLFADRVDFTPAARAAGASTMLVSASAVAVLWLRRRSVLNQWLMIVALATILEMALGSISVSARFSLGFYAGRLFSLLTSTIVLVVLLAETTRLYANVTRSNEGKIRRLVEANILGICIWNLDGTIVEANEAFLRMLQYCREDVVSGRLRWTDLTPADWCEQDERAVAELRSTGTFHPFEKEYFRKNSTRIPVLIGGALFEESRDEGVAFVLDLTERKRAEEALHELELDFARMNRVSMMGVLAASLTHEITQPIATARNNACAALNFLNRQPSDLGAVREALDCVVNDADRAGNIVDRVRDQMKKAPPRKARFDLNEAIDEVIVLARTAITKNEVSVQTRLTDDLLPVQGDRVQLQQVVLNLVLNAVEAMGSVEAGARELSIMTGQDQTGVRVAVRDCGPGIDPDHRERIFQTFYTTKSSGTGMGLSICRSIINGHGGRLWVEANEPRGAVFQFTLPGTERELDGNANTVTAAGARTDCPAGSGV